MWKVSPNGLASPLARSVNFALRSTEGGGWSKKASRWEISASCFIFISVAAAACLPVSWSRKSWRSGKFMEFLPARDGERCSPTSPLSPVFPIVLDTKGNKAVNLSRDRWPRLPLTQASDQVWTVCLTLFFFSCYRLRMPCWCSTNKPTDTEVSPADALLVWVSFPGRGRQIDLCGNDWGNARFTVVERAANLGWLWRGAICNRFISVLCFWSQFETLPASIALKNWMLFNSSQFIVV